MNSDIIRLLPDSVANQIAAGEVIQRPASVIKELVENSIDAGATAIEIIIKDAGRTLIQVIDNGRGMSPTDARMAFERHATSKITAVDDLYALHTMGFRGEALPSIAAVAQIELRTMQQDDTLGSRLLLSESQFISQEPCVSTKGTNIMVKNLFFHMPARRKYLKKDSVELSHIMHEFERLALVNTDVEFTFINNGETLYKLLRGNLKQRITSLLGKAIGSQIIPVATETSMVRISGFVGLPHNARRRNAPQYFFVNGRNMRHPYFHKAVVNCYAELIAADMQPVYFINMEVEPSTIDVNVHPQKHEIKFLNEQPIWQILSAAVKQALGKVNAAGAIDFDADQMPEIPVFLPDNNAGMPSIATDDSYNPFDITETPGARVEVRAAPTRQSDNGQSSAPRRDYVPRDWDKLYESFTGRRDTSTTVEVRAASMPAIDDAPPQPETPRLDSLDCRAQVTSFITIGRKYIAADTDRGLMLIDRYRAHVRVLYDQFISTLATRQLVSQQLIFPESVTLSPAQSSIISAMGDSMAALGFDVSFLGDNTWAVNAVPAIKGNPIETLVRLAADLAESGEVSADSLLRPAAISLARSAAVTTGSELTDAETQAIINSLLESPNAAYTPDGLPTTVTLDTDAIAKLLI